MTNYHEAALRTFFNVMNAWNISIDNTSKILGCTTEEIETWKEGHYKAQVDENIMIRISHILGIYRALHTIYNDDEVADTWPVRPNDSQFFKGERPIQYLLSGKLADLEQVHSILEQRLHLG